MTYKGITVKFSKVKNMHQWRFTYKGAEYGADIATNIYNRNLLVKHAKETIDQLLAVKDLTLA